MTVYIVVRHSPDVQKHMVNILGVFEDREAAARARQGLWDENHIVAQVMTYESQDERWPMEMPVKTPRRKFTR